MQAKIGDRIVVHSRTQGQPTREGTVRDIRAGQVQPIYRVEWDDGTETLYAPTSGIARVVAEGADEASHDVTIRLESTVELIVTEIDDRSECVATLHTTRGSFTGEGAARRRDDDPDVPMIGEELSIARALRALSETLLDAAGEALEDGESRPIHLIT